MAKSIPPPATSASRRSRLASFEAARRSEQRRRTVGLLAICGVLAIALLAYPVYLFVGDYQQRNARIGDLGVATAAAGCGPVDQHPATGNQDHVAEGTKVAYDPVPPDSGKHYPSPASFAKHFYTVEDRPGVETLVHNLEHGYTVVWYRADAPSDQIDTLRAIGKTFASDNYDPTEKFIAAPWSTEDGAGFPAGKNVVLTRWTANPDNPGDTKAQKGVRQACGSVSGTAIADFMTAFPERSSPEPNGA